MLFRSLREYGRRHGWVHGADLEKGELRRAGCLPLHECVGHLRRYLHVDLDDYRRNLEAVRSNAARLVDMRRAISALVRFSATMAAESCRASTRLIAAAVTSS